MENNNKNIFKKDYLDIIFEGHNKAYGGYVLRKKYANRAVLGTLLTIGIIGGLFASTLFKMPEKKPPPPPPIDKTVELAEPPPLKENQPPPPPPPPAPPPVMPTVKFTPPVIKPNEEVRKEDKPEPPKPQENKAVGAENVKGDENSGVPPELGNPGGTGAGKPAPPPPKPPVVEDDKPQEPLRSVQKMPKFPGDINRYLADNIRYPALASEQGIEGQVVLEFVVGVDGRVSNIQVKRGQGGGLTEEAVRVVKGMPKWTPGEQNGRTVPVYYTLPVRFTLKNQ